MVASLCLCVAERPIFSYYIGHPSFFVAASSICQILYFIYMNSYRGSFDLLQFADPCQHEMDEKQYVILL